MQWELRRFKCYLGRLRLNAMPVIRFARNNQVSKEIRTQIDPAPADKTEVQIVSLDAFDKKSVGK